ncbi:metal-sulfur cluster assembly factor [Streptomyces sp. NPDC054919]
MSLTDEVRAALRTVVDPCSIATGVPINLVDMGLINAISVQGRDVAVTLQLTSPFCMQIGLMNERMEEALGRIPGIGKIRIEVDHGAEWVPEMMAETSRAALRRVRPLPLVTSK